MRIVILSTLYPPIVQGGAEQAAALLAEALAQSGNRVAVITLHPGDEEMAETMNGVRVYRVPQGNSFGPSMRGSNPRPPDVFCGIFGTPGTGRPPDVSAKYLTLRNLMSCTLTAPAGSPPQCGRRRRSGA